MKIIAEYSDYAIQSIEFFIRAIETGLAARDLSGLTKVSAERSAIEKINVSKEHPIVVEMASTLQNRNGEPLRTSIIPAIAITPGNLSEDGVTLGKSYQPMIVDDNWIAEMKEILGMDMKTIWKEKGLISHAQAEAIIGAYRRKGPGGILRCQKNQWNWNEEINVSCWSDKADIDNFMSVLVDSILMRIVTGFAGDESPIKNMKYKPSRGLTNFNFGRVLYGTEFNLTFLNTYNNYTIYQEEHITQTRFTGGYDIPGSEDRWQSIVTAPETE